MNALKRNWGCWFLAAVLAGVPCGCAHMAGNGSNAESENGIAATRAIRVVQQEFAPDKRLRIFDVGVQDLGGELVLTGEVDSAEARIETVRAVEGAGAKITDRINVLPDEKLGDQAWGISCVSVNSGRALPSHKAEMGTQVLMGNVVHLWKCSTNFAFAWYLTQSGDGYLTWLEEGTFVRCTREQVENWNRGPLLVVTACEECIRERPDTDAQPVSDVVLCDLVRKTGQEGDWCKVALPDGRTGFLPTKACADYEAWKKGRRPTAANIEQTALMFLGRPYLWGGNSPKGFDCSGLTKTVFFLNGIDLMRDASLQAKQGKDVPTNFNQLKEGDLLFFGSPASPGKPEFIGHVGIYLGDKRFIHSSVMVHISSLDPASPIADETWIRTLVRARRVLPGE